MWLTVALTVLTVASFAAASSGPAALAAAKRTSIEPLTVPAGFTDTLFASVPKAVALDVTPDGRFLVVDQSGRIRVVQNGTLVTTPALDLSAKVCSGGERGMLGIAVDPQFASNGYVYVYYTFKKYPVCKVDAADVPVNRVSRFKMVGNTINPSSEKVLVGNMISYHGNHNAGDVGFGKDGLLYVSVGDGACDFTGLSGCEPSNTLATRRNTLLGKVMRINKRGGIPSGNPFTGTGTARCNQGAIAEGMVCQEIYVYGLRNPFRFAFDPNAAKTRMFINDVGEATWEEIDKVVKGANYGWNRREGFCVTGSTSNCGPPPAGLTNPVFAYPHSTGCRAITGGGFIPSGAWGPSYNGAYFYGDYICGKIFYVRPNGSGGWASTSFATGLTGGGPIAMMFAPHGSATSLYYTSQVNGGELHVIDKA